MHIHHFNSPRLELHLIYGLSDHYPKVYYISLTGLLHFSSNMGLLWFVAFLVNKHLN